MIYLIKEIWIDPFENKSCNAYGYETIGYVNTFEEAEEWLYKGRDFDVNDCWAIKQRIPQYIYQLVKKLT